MLYPRIEVHSLRDCALSVERDPRELHTGKGGLAMEFTEKSIADLLAAAFEASNEFLDSPANMAILTGGSVPYFQVIVEKDGEERAFNVSVSEVL